MDLGWVNFDLYDPSSCPAQQKQNEEGSGMTKIKYQPTTSVNCSDTVKKDYILPISLKGPHCRPEDSDSDRGAGPRGGRDNRQRERGAECGRARQRRGGVREAPEGERGLVVRLDGT